MAHDEMGIVGLGIQINLLELCCLAKTDWGRRPAARLTWHSLSRPLVPWACRLGDLLIWYRSGRWPLLTHLAAAHFLVSDSLVAGADRRPPLGLPEKPRGCWLTATRATQSSRPAKFLLGRKQASQLGRGPWMMFDHLGWQMTD
jgi:hypothetical protein